MMIQRCLILAIAFILTVGCAASKKTASENAASAETMTENVAPEKESMTKESISEMTSTALGDWEYVISNLPDGDARGIFTIKNDSDKYSGTIESEAGSTGLNSLVIEENILKSTTFEAQGYTIEMSGTFEGDAFTGKIYVAGYEFPMSAKKKK